MATAKKQQIATSQVHFYADIFLEEIAQQTGCSAAFLEAARPAVERLYADVEGDALEDCLDSIRETIVRQAETEQCARRSLEAAKRLETLQAQMSANLDTMRTTVQRAHAAVHSAAFQLHHRHNGIIYRA